MRSPTTPEAGQASVELVALLPLLVVIGLVGWQIVVAGQAVWTSAAAARSAARAHAVGGDAEAAARRALPRHLRDHVRVRAGDDGVVRVAVGVPSVVGDLRLGSVAAQAQFVAQGGR